jgi:hypothetical protein
MTKSRSKTKASSGPKRGPGFKKGQTGNPNGRPKGTGHPTFETILATIKREHSGIFDWHHPDHGIVNDPLQQAVIQLSVAVQNGESWAICEMLNRGFGKPHQSVAMEHKGNVTINFDKQDEGL